MFSAWHGTSWIRSCQSPHPAATDYFSSRPLCYHLYCAHYPGRSSLSLRCHHKWQFTSGELSKIDFLVMTKHHCYILLQFNIINLTTSDFVRAIQLPLTSQENISRMVASNNGEYIFAMTPSRVRPLHGRIIYQSSDIIES